MVPVRPRGAAARPAQQARGRPVPRSAAVAPRQGQSSPIAAPAGRAGPAQGRDAPPSLQARRAHPPPASQPFLRGTAARPAPPASPHVIGVPARELADILVHVLEAFLGFLQLLLQRAHRHRHTARRAAWPGPARGSAGKQGEQAPPTPVAAGREGAANRAPVAPSDSQSLGTRVKRTPLRMARRKSSPITEPRDRVASRLPN